jgi:hypothetical protein
MMRFCKPRAQNDAGLAFSIFSMVFGVTYILMSFWYAIAFLDSFECKQPVGYRSSISGSITQLLGTLYLNTAYQIPRSGFYDHSHLPTRV